MRLQCVLFILSFWLGGVVFSQTLNELSQSNDGYKKDVKALVIGISDYQNIRSLNYAHRDAEEFAKFLQDNPFWNVEEGNIFLFTNENARQGDILMGLQWLMETTTEEQEVIFYFSGHGDVENVDGQDQGFLLAHDAPKNNYAMGGTIAVSMLDSAFTELIRRNVKINIIVDACKSGQLAGGMTGTGHTNETLAAKWTSQIRILSAQPNQLSLEDEKWGDGRGVFSYFLIRGMSGYANADNDELIRLNEIENYLGENLAKQTLGAQQPIVDGPNKWTKNFSVKDTTQMALYEDDEVESELTNLVASTKAGEDQVTESCKALYGTTQEKIKAFNRDAFLEITADYAALMACSGDQYASLRYEYMRQLINQINAIVSDILSGKKFATEEEAKYGIELINELFELNKGKKLIGRTHFQNLYTFFKGLHYMESAIGMYDVQRFLLTCKGFTLDPDYLQEESRLIFSSGGLIKYHVDGPTSIKELELTDTTQVIEWFARENDSYEFLQLLEDKLNGAITLDMVFFDDTIRCVTKAFEDEKVKREIAYIFQGPYYESLLRKQLKEAIEKEPDAAYLKYAAAFFMNQMGDSKDAILTLNEAIENSPTWLTPQYTLATLYERKRKFDDALFWYNKALSLDSMYRDFECVDCFFLGLINLNQHLGNEEEMQKGIEAWKTYAPHLDDFDRSYMLFENAMSDRRRKSAKYWLDEMDKNSSDILEDRWLVLASNIQLRNSKKFNEEVRDLAIALVEEFDDLSYLLEEPEFRYELLPETEAAGILFPKGQKLRYFAEWDIDTMSWQYAMIQEQNLDLGWIFDVLAESKGSDVEDYLNAFCLYSINKMNSIERFYNWLLALDQVQIYYSLRANYDMYTMEYEYDTYDAMDYILRDQFSNGYLYHDHYMDRINEEHLINLLDGKNLLEMQDVQKLLNSANTYEEELLVEEIRDKLAAWDSYK